LVQRASAAGYRVVAFGIGSARQRLDFRDEARPSHHPDQAMQISRLRDDVRSRRRRKSHGLALLAMLCASFAAGATGAGAGLTAPESSPPQAVFSAGGPSGPIARPAASDPASSTTDRAGALAAYVAQADPSYGWREASSGRIDGVEYVELILT
jgi:hypothetical protein